ncbi:MAG: hypothetical protein ACP5UD_08835 [Conexivisphaera sp.]
MKYSRIARGVKLSPVVDEVIHALGFRGRSVPQVARALLAAALRRESGEIAGSFGVPHDVAWWDATVLPALVGGYVLTGAERRVPDEPVRGLHDYDAVKPKLHCAHDRYADAYLPMRT